MIYFFYLLSFILVLILSEIIAKKEKTGRITYNKKSKEDFSDFKPYVARNGRTPQSLSQISKRLTKINPFDKCGDIFNKSSDFNWPSYFANANKKMTTLAFNQVFF
jgi:hypothetical protein